MLRVNKANIKMISPWNIASLTAQIVLSLIFITVLCIPVILLLLNCNFMITDMFKLIFLLIVGGIFSFTVVWITRFLNRI